MYVVLIILAGLIGVYSFLQVTEVTYGVWLLGIAVFLAVIGRIVQAQEDDWRRQKRHDALMAALQQREQETL